MAIQTTSSSNMELQLATKPKLYGKSGEIVRLNANHFKVDLHNYTDLVQYHIDIQIQTEEQDEKYGGLTTAKTKKDAISKENEEENEEEKEENVNEGGEEEEEEEKMSISRSLQKVSMKKDLSNEDFKVIIQKFITRHKDDLFSKPNSFVHDGRGSLYTRGKLPLTGKKQVFTNFSVFDADCSMKPRADGRPFRLRKYKVILTYVGLVPMKDLKDYLNNVPEANPMTAIQALDIALRYSANFRLTQIGRNFFNATNSRALSNGKEIWFGYHQSLRPTQSGLTLNVDSSATLFVQEQLLVDYIASILKNNRFMTNGIHPQDITTVNQAIRGLKITITHRQSKKKSKVLCIGLPGNQQMFEFNGRKTSVSSYFEERYPGTLKYPKLNVVQVYPKKKNEFYPLEVCKILSGQKYSGRLSTEDSQEMIKQLCQPPRERERMIHDRLKEANFARDSHVEGFGLKVGSKMLAVEGRVLESPSVRYTQAVITPRGGSWNLNNPKIRFMDAAKLQYWGIVTMGRLNNRLIPDFIQNFCRIAETHGIQVLDKKPIVVHCQVEDKGIAECLDKIKKESGKLAQIVFVIKPSKDTPSYKAIKVFSDTKAGLPTQVLVAENLYRNNRINPSYLANVLLKVNMKLGGKNSYLQERLPKVADMPTMIIGADVSHPGMGDMQMPSIAAVTSCIDMYGCKYISRVRQQEKTTEIIADMRVITKELLISFYQHTGAKPRQIIVYRDGVGEGMFKEVVKHEFVAIRKACQDLESNYLPKITFVVVRKRHHTRFFPQSSSDGDRSGNVKSGTIVDQVVCNPQDFDFYLCSHGGLKGTSRPTYYTVVVDEIGFSADEIQKLSFYLCHCFTRCTKAVSIVAPVYYAHLLAFRCRFFLKYSSQASTSDWDLEGEIERIHPNLINSMFYV